MKIYLSFSRKDGNKNAEIVTSSFKDAGHEVITDVDVKTSEPMWAKLISRQLNEVDIVLAIITQGATTKSRVGVETSYAQYIKKSIIVFHPDSSAEIPYHLLGYEIIKGSPNQKDTISRLLEQINKQTNRIRDFSDSGTASISSSAILTVELSGQKVFIAYSRKQRYIAQDISDLLSHNGKPHFWDAQIKAGATWRQTIQKALDDCTHLIVIWTEDAAESDEVEREVSYALAEGKIIIPILSKDIPKLPYHLHGFHYVVLEDDLNTIEDAIIKAIENYSDDDIWQ